jgi:glutamate dehydrogenase/leucine dehydrogenase
MPSEPEAIERYLDAGILFGPGKAANAGGVAVSGLEMSQNSIRLSWSRKEVDGRLHDIMREIHRTCVKYGKDGDFINYVNGANVGGFIKVADSMLDQGLV